MGEYPNLSIGEYPKLSTKNNKYENVQVTQLMTSELPEPVFVSGSYWEISKLIVLTSTLKKLPKVNIVQWPTDEGFVSSNIK